MAKRDLIGEFGHWFLFEEDRAQSTVDNYVGALRRVQKTLGPLEDLTEETLRAYEWENRGIGDDAWNGSYHALRAFYSWLSEAEGVDDPSIVLRRRKKRPTARPLASDLFDRIAMLPPLDRKLAQLIYMTELEPFQVRSMIEQRSRGPEFVVPSRGKRQSIRVHLEPDAHELLVQLRRGRPKSKRGFEKAFQKKGEGLTAQEIRAAAREDRGAPALRVLVRYPEFSDVAAGLRSALAQMDANPARAIQDAATALEDLLRALRAEGNSLGPLVKNARRRGLLGHDENLAEAIKTMVDWVNADRVERGTGHSVRRGLIDDAWLTLRVVEALIIRLAKGFPAET